MADSDEFVDAGLEERLQNHSRAFESLLALTPAREYFGNQIVDGRDPSEQWNRKKQTKEEKRAAKKAKLDPANQKSALDIMKERELKRKRELGLEELGSEETKATTEETGEGNSKRQKTGADADAAIAKKRAQAEKKKAKRQAKEEKIAKKKAKTEAQKAIQQDLDLDEAQASNKSTTSQNVSNVELEGPEAPSDFTGFDASGLADSDSENAGVNDISTAPSSPAVESPAFDIATNHSTASSSSSIVPPSEPDTLARDIQKASTQKRPIIDTSVASAVPPSLRSADAISGTTSPKLQLPNIDQAQLQERLRVRIEELRAKRKADGKTVKSRQELLEQRRKRDELRKAAKKEQRRKQKEDEQKKLEAQHLGSGSPLRGDVFAKSTPEPHNNNFSFGRLAFQDGTAADANLTGLIEPRKAKGRSDPKTALEAAQKKQARIAGFDETKQADIAEKDLWLNARKRAHGERVRDDTSLLKKALKRKEKQKSKSEKQWQEREQAVVKAKEMKQKKRETNLQKRRDEKGVKGKKKGGVKGGGKKKGRPGFEGRFKA